MKKRYIILLFSVLIGLKTTAQSPDWQWVKTSGGNSFTTGKSIATDASGNVFVTGLCDGPSITLGTITLNIAADGMFVAKYDDSGNILWAKSTIGTGGAVRCTGITTDSNGNVIVIGNYTCSTIAFGTTTFINPIPGREDIFVVKYDASGNILWAKNGSGTFYDNIYGVTTDLNGNVLITGYFASDTIDFGTIKLINQFTGNNNPFIVKYDSSGNVLWARAASGTCIATGTGICADRSGNVFVSGWYEYMPITFDSITLPGAVNDDVFVLKYDASGNLLWAKAAGGTDLDQNSGISVDLNGNVLTTGVFQSPSITFGTTTLTNTGSGVLDIYVVKYDSMGNVLWAKSFGGSDIDFVHGICTGVNGNLLLTGYFMSPVLIFGSITLTNTAVSTSDIFIVNYDSSGNELWAKSAGGTDVDVSSGIATDVNGNVLITGLYHSQQIAFGLDTLNNSAGNYLFIAKLDSAIVLGIAGDQNGRNSINVFPNPNNGKIRISSHENIVEIKIIDLTGHIVYQTIPSQLLSEVSLQLDKPGIYFIQITLMNQIVTKKIIVSN